MIHHCIEPAVRCRVCREFFVRADTGWVCPRALHHSGIITDDQVRNRIEAKYASLSWRTKKSMSWRSANTQSVFDELLNMSAETMKTILRTA